MKFDPLKDYYQILHVPIDADLETLKKAYRVRALECHPDRGGSHEAMLDVIEAFKILTNPESRQHYNNARRDLFNQNAQSIIQADISKARQTAEGYPRDWKEFESWSNVLMNIGVEAAKGMAGFIGRYIFGSVLCIIGYVVANIFGASNSGDASSYGGIGLITVLFIGFLVWAFKRPNPTGNSPITPESPIPQNRLVGEHITITQCRMCGQQMRITSFGSPIRIRCPNSKCRFEFCFDSKYS